MHRGGRGNFTSIPTRGRGRGTFKYPPSQPRLSSGSSDEQSPSRDSSKGRKKKEGVYRQPLPSLMDGYHPQSAYRRPQQQRSYSNDDPYSNLPRNAREPYNSHPHYPHDPYSHQYNQPPPLQYPYETRHELDPYARSPQQSHDCYNTQPSHDLHNSYAYSTRGSFGVRGGAPFRGGRSRGGHPSRGSYY
jgi:hypothetical protein